MKKKGFTLVELLVVIAIIALLMGILMPALARVRQIAFRMVCGTNLSGIGKAMLIYANDYSDSLPRAGGRNSEYGTPVVWDAANRIQAYGCNADGTGGHGTISASFYLLVKYAEVTPKSFICKGDTGVSEFEPTNNIDMTMLWDFGPSTEAASHCSYTLQQPYSPYALSTTSDPGMCIAADPNPWLNGDRDTSVFSEFGVTGGKEITKLGNSINHQDEGQNVLFLDSHVNFESVSFCGVNEDNIYTRAASITDVKKGVMPNASNVQPLNRSDNVLLSDVAGGGGGGGKGSRVACFLGDTQVCVDGTFMPISQVTAGQTVEKLEEHVGSFDCRDIEFTNGNKISVVALHYFMLDSGIWVRSIDLRSGMTLRTQSGNVVIKSVATRDYTGKVYNVKVKNAEQYLVGQDSVVARDW
ncbi:MAG: prepilin-type N-terminal cleavage/methylation domain-containing protein [Sedimentisphaerales bacterium]